MIIKSFEVVDFMGRPGKITHVLHEDLNIFTGRNGCGKTSLLKLLWYVLSGKILMALREIRFSKFRLITSEYDCTIHRLSRHTCKIEFEQNGKRIVYEDEVDHDGDVFSNAEDEPNKILSSTGDSVFLPTFRRIEGGFTLESNNNLFSRVSKAKNDVEEALIALSGRLSENSHTFVSSISTKDIVSLLMKKYTDLSDTYNAYQQSTSQDIIGKIKNFKSGAADKPELKKATNLIDQIRAQIEGMEGKREEIMNPMEGVRRMVSTLFKHSGIKFGTRLNFGEAAGAVNSDVLSAGEKQMLSFICYNAFYVKSVIFIDEPELSLHVDWQRQLFSVLTRQNSSNQFIVATHSPFIYSKYPDKETVLDTDKGDAELMQ